MEAVMREEIKDKVKEYVRRMVDEFALVRGIRVMEAMEDFSAYIDSTRGEGWDLADVTGVDIHRYYEEHYQTGDRDAERYLVEVHRFFQFAECEGWRERRKDEE
jgi:site-specific recombinase XerD